MQSGRMVQSSNQPQSHWSFGHKDAHYAVPQEEGEEHKNSGPRGRLMTRVGWVADEFGTRDTATRHENYGIANDDDLSHIDEGFGCSLSNYS